MGQQQLLLVILVTIIVGIATIVAFNVMQNANENSIESAIRQDIMMIFNDARIYYNKPEMMDGGGDSFDEISEENFLSVEPENENGSYEISSSESSVTVEGISTNGDITISGTATMTDDGMDISWSEPDE